MRLLSTAPGIGDGLFIVQKLINAKEKFIIRIPNSYPQRGKSVWDLLPQVTESAYYDNFRFREVRFRNHAASHVFWKDIQDKEIFLEANTHVESGKRIEGFLPDLPTSFKLKFKIDVNQENRALDLIYSLHSVSPLNKLIGIYCASYAGSRNWGTWGLDEWLQLVELMNEPDRTFVIIGAPYDDLTQELFQKLLEKNIPAINTVGEDLGTTIEVLKRLDMFIGFPSGLSIVNELCGAKKTFMFYSKAIKNIINTWGDPKRIESGELKECLFCSPEQTFEWIKNNWTI